MNESPLAELRKWVREQIDGREEIRLPDLTDEAIAHFSADADFQRAFFVHAIRDSIYEQVSYVLYTTRTLVPFGDELLTPDTIKRRARNTFSTWMEHAEGRHVRLLDMTREDLKAAAAERRERGQHEFEIAVLWEALARRLKKGERVRDRFTAEEIDAVRQQLREKGLAA